MYLGDTPKPPTRNQGSLYPPDFWNKAPFPSLPHSLSLHFVQGRLRGFAPLHSSFFSALLEANRPKMKRLARGGAGVRVSARVTEETS